MAKKQSVKKKRRVPKTVLRLSDLDQAKSAVLNSLSSVDAQRGHRHAIKEFVEWYCSEPRTRRQAKWLLMARNHNTIQFLSQARRRVKFRGHAGSEMGGIQLGT